jgi:hypothetical protein
MIDIFAGRIFAEEVFKSAAYNALRQCLVKRAAVTS